MKKRKKKNQKKFLYIILGLIIIVFIIVFLKKPETTSKENKRNIKYSEEVITIMKEKNIYDEITEKEYSKTIETLLQENAYNSKYLNQYTQINYQEKEDFSSLTNSLLEKNYSPKEINDILEYLNDTNLQKIKEQDYIDLKDYVKISNMEIDKIERYENYKKSQNIDAKDAVTKVNIGLDLKFYSQIETIKDPDSYTTLLNKYRGLPENYAPKDLTPLSINSNYKLRKEAANAYENLQNAAILDNVKFYPFSTYRTKEYQNRLYTNYVKRDGTEAADTYSARPRHSEHELGLAVDIRSEGLSDNLTDEHYKWMLDNSYKYGFIVRYPKGSTSITGYIEEPWHLRYLGIDIATNIHEKNITFDEYYDLYLKESHQ